MRTILIPDTHLQHSRAERILSKEKPYDKVVFLGDYFDDFYDNPEWNAGAAKWLKESLLDPKRIHLIGNHDLNYHCDNKDFNDWRKAFACSGFTMEKYKAIREILPDKTTWGKLKWHVIEQGWLITHAGLDTRHCKMPAPSLKKIDNFLNTEAILAERQFINGAKHWFFEAGASRRGSAEVGGIVWCDANKEFQPIPKVKQIFGHTYQRGGPKWIKEYDEFPNVCLDTNLYDYGVLEDGLLQMKDYMNL